MKSEDQDSCVREPFLGNSNSSPEGSLLDENEKTRNSIKRQRQALRHIKWLLIILLVSYVPVCIAFAWLYIRLGHQQNTSSCTKPDLLPSPARESGVISYEVRPLDVSITNNPFSGRPSPASDQAWHALIEHNNIIISREEAERANIKTLELADGSGRHVVVPAVGHQIHCLKRIRHWVYRDYYHSNDTEQALEESEAHVNHCIEMLRQEVMCHGDQSFSSLYYLNDSDPRSFTAQDFSMHQCVDWSKLRQWMVDRSVKVTTPGLFKFPYHLDLP